MITQEEILNEIEYNPDDGVFRWLRIKSGRKMDREPGFTITGSNNPKTSYRYIGINGRKYAAHIIAWIYMKGCAPAGQIDHKNGDGLDNRFENLREASAHQNCINRTLRKDNKTGLIGVHFCEDRQRWIGSIKVNGRCISKRFHTREEAKRHRKMLEDTYFNEGFVPRR